MACGFFYAGFGQKKAVFDPCADRDRTPQRFFRLGSEATDKDE
jgi:hypothetical protein